MLAVSCMESATCGFCSRRTIWCGTGSAFLLIGAPCKYILLWSSDTHFESENEPAAVSSSNPDQMIFCLQEACGAARPRARQKRA